MPGIHEILTPTLIARILDEAFHILQHTGVMVQSQNALRLLVEVGAKVDGASQVVHLSEKIVRQALYQAPQEFYLYNRQGQAVVHYGGDDVAFDPGSCAVHVLEPDTLEYRPSISTDLLRVIQLVEALPQFAAQSTALVCHDVAPQIGDIYRLYLVLLYSAKPIVTGAFSVETTQPMFDLLAIAAGGRQPLIDKPLAVFDVCPTPPLIWSEFASENLIALARAGIPAQMVSMPLAGVAAPVTLLGSIVQHAAECLSGIVIHQSAAPGAPIVWGGAPAIFDMRHGTTPMGAIETAMIDMAYAQVGKSLRLPTHAYLGASDAKIVDAQAGLESGISALLGAMAGINMISGAGMLDFLACFSSEKLVIDAEAIAMAQRFTQGIHTQTDPLATTFFENIDFKPEFLKQKATRQLFAKEQWLPSRVIDRSTLRAWQQSGKNDAFARSRSRLDELLNGYQRPTSLTGCEDELRSFVLSLAKPAGMENLPNLLSTS